MNTIRRIKKARENSTFIGLGMTVGSCITFLISGFPQSEALGFVLSVLAGSIVTGWHLRGRVRGESL